MPPTRRKRRTRASGRKKKSPSTQAGEFVRKEIESVRAGEHGARSAKQVIAIGLSKARRAGVKLPPPAKGDAPSHVRRKARQDLAAGRRGTRPSRKRSRGTLRALKRESTSAASHEALSRHARKVARKKRRRARRKK